MSSPPGRPATSRYRMPIEPPTRKLLIASLASIAGACQLFAWALARLPTFFVALGVILIGLGLGVALAALVQRHRLRWVAYVGPASLTVPHGNRREVLPWGQVEGSATTTSGCGSWAVTADLSARCRSIGRVRHRRPPVNCGKPSRLSWADQIIDDLALDGKRSNRGRSQSGSRSHGTRPRLGPAACSRRRTGWVAQLQGYIYFFYDTTAPAYARTIV